MKKLLLIRHGETAVNVSGGIHSRNDSASLTEKGQQQARAAAENCRDNNVELVYSSPEKRAKETAHIIAEFLDKTVTIIPEFYERDWGDWQNLTWDEIKPHLDQMNLSERYEFVPPQGESWKMMEERLKAGLEELKQSRGDSIAVVLHGGVIRAFIPLLLAESKEKSFEFDVKNGEVLIFSFDGNSFFLQ